MSALGRKVGQHSHLLWLPPPPPQPASLLQQRPEELAARWHEVPHPRGWSWLGMEGDGEAEGGGFGRAGGGPAETRGCNLLMRLPTDP